MCNPCHTSLHHCHYVTVFTNRTAPIFTFIIPQMLHTSVFTIQRALWKNIKYCFPVQIKCQNSHESTGTVLYNYDIRIQNIPWLSICLYNRTDKTPPPYKPMISVPRMWVDGGRGVEPPANFSAPYIFHLQLPGGPLNSHSPGFWLQVIFLQQKCIKPRTNFSWEGTWPPFLYRSTCTLSVLYTQLICVSVQVPTHDSQLMWTGNYQFTSGCFILKVFFHLHWNRQCIDLCFWHMLQNAVTTSIL